MSNNILYYKECVTLRNNLAIVIAKAGPYSQDKVKDR